MEIKIARTADGHWHARGNTSCSKSDNLDFDQYTIAELNPDTGEWPGLELTVCEICTELLIDRYKR
jgi:hypothetical protein